MSENLDSGALDAGNAIRLAQAMREKAEAQRGADAARAALEAAERRLEGAGREVEELKSGVTFEDLLELVASLSLRVAELESGGPRPQVAAAAPPPVDAGSGGASEEDRDWDLAAPSGVAVAEAAVVSPAPQGAAPAAPAAESDEDDPFADSESHEGRRGPNRPVLYMNAYARGYAEARDGVPENISGTRGWEFKGYRDGRRHAAASLDFDPLGAFAQEMKACRTPIEPKVREQARKLSLILANEHANRLPGEPAGSPAGQSSSGGAAAGGDDGNGDDGSDDNVEIPGFLQRARPEVSAE